MVVTNDATPTFTFSSTDASFECQVDDAPFAACASPYTTAELADGEHTFSVRAKDSNGIFDPTPATRTFSVDTTPPDTFIDSGPAPQVHSGTLTFTTRASEPGTIACSLDDAPYGSCEPIDAGTLAVGAHSYRAKATDRAGNTDATPAEYRFSVVNQAPLPTLSADTTQATIGATDQDGDALTYSLDFGDGQTSTGTLPHDPIAHTFPAPGDYTVTLQVGDGRTTTTVTQHVNVPFTQSSPPLSLTLGTADAGLGTFLPQTQADYTTSVVATTTVPSAGALTVHDPSTTAPGHLVNGEYVLPQALQAKAGDGAFAPISGTPLTLLDVLAAHHRPTEHDRVQAVDRRADPLRAGRYEKTLTFTLSLTNP